jgi:hypothetical protein
LTFYSVVQVVVVVEFRRVAITVAVAVQVE